MTSDKAGSGAEARNEIAALWCARMADGPLDREQQAGFDTWVREDDANWPAFEAIAGLWDDLDSRADMPEMLGLRAGALNWLRRINGRRWTWLSRKSRWPVWVGMAAAFALVMFGLIGAMTPQALYQTGVGERRVVALADGSHLSLDAASAVSVRFDHNRRALTLLSGRAKFNVAKDPTRPFTVTAGDHMVVATGTSFSVELVRHQMRVVLYEGHVAVLDTSEGNKSAAVRLAGKREAADVALTPGHELVSSNGSDVARVMPADVDRSLSWEAGQLNFREAPLGETTARMNRYSSTKIIVDPGAENVPIDGVFEAGDTDAFVESVAVLYPVRVIRAQNGVHLAARPGGS
jgi:transmembrane sensor